MDLWWITWRRRLLWLRRSLMWRRRRCYRWLSIWKVEIVSWTRISSSWKIKSKRWIRTCLLYNRSIWCWVLKFAVITWLKNSRWKLTLSEWIKEVPFVIKTTAGQSHLWQSRTSTRMVITFALTGSLITFRKYLMTQTMSHFLPKAVSGKKLSSITLH